MPGRRASEKQKSVRVKRALLAAALAPLLCGAAAVCFSLPSVASAAATAAELSAKLIVPGGTETIFRMSAASEASAVSAEADPETAESAQSKAVSSRAVSTAVSAVAGRKPVKTLQLLAANGVRDQTYQGISVNNQTAGHMPDIAKQLAIRPDIHLFAKSGPQVLIIHTHTTESYATSDSSSYDPKASGRTTDRSKSVVRVGDEIAQALEQNGIGVIHDTSYYDYPDFDAAYDNSLAAIENTLKQYPSIQVVLDIHRDAIQYSDGTRVRPTAVIAGKKAAQVLVVAPCDEQTSLPVPDWQYNYRFALRLQQKMCGLSPGLARPLSLCPRRYNMQATHGSLLVEIGTDMNTLDEAVYAGQLFGEALSQTLLGLKD